MTPHARISYSKITRRKYKNINQSWSHSKLKWIKLKNKRQGCNGTYNPNKNTLTHSKPETTNSNNKNNLKSNRKSQ